MTFESSVFAVPPFSVAPFAVPPARARRRAASLAVAALASACAYGLAIKCASAQAGAPFNGLDHIERSLEDLRDDVRARAGWRRSEWICQEPSGPCVWRAGYWGPPPAPIPPARTGYFTLESLRGFPWIGPAPQR